jgi:hypothetical protein
MAKPSAMAAVQRRCVVKVHRPPPTPISATPAAEPTANGLPPVPAVKVAKSHCALVRSGSMLKTANITGMLSTTAEATPRGTCATVGPSPPSSPSASSSK